ncbi:MAG: MbnP family protein [Myxococcales bacterium]
MARDVIVGGTSLLIRWLVTGVVATSFSLGLGCTPANPASGNSGTGGEPATGGRGGVPMGSGGAGPDSGVGDAGDGDGCPENPTPRLSTGTVLELVTEFDLGGKPLVIGEENPLAEGGTLTPLNLRLYVSQVSLRRDDGTSVSVDLVTAAGGPEIYGVHLVNADKGDSLRLRVLAPAGNYSGIDFLLGLTDPCNAGSTMRKAPLSDSSEMTWPHPGLGPFGYLFLRFESRMSPGTTPDADAGASPVDGGAPTLPSMIHMGGQVGRVFAPIVHAPGAVTVPATGQVRRRLRVIMNEVFKAAVANIDLSDFTGIRTAEVMAGEKVRRAAPTAPLFVLSAP